MQLTGSLGDVIDTDYFTSLISKPKCVKAMILWNVAPPTPQGKANLEEVVIGSKMDHRGKEKWKTQTSAHNTE